MTWGRPLSSLDDAARKGGGRLKARPHSGVTSVQMLVILVPVLFGMIGFAVDLGILYSVRAELRAGAAAMALAAAQQLNGTEAASGSATAAGLRTVETGTGFGNRYYFHGFPIGETSGTLTSTVSDPLYYGAAADALANAGGEVSGSLARMVRFTVTGQTQLLFWSFLPVVGNRNIDVVATAVAGISAPLCTACGIEPFAVGAIDAADTTNFGYEAGTKYSFSFLCNGASPALLAGAARQIPYLLLNRLDENATAFAAESTQAFRAGAGGLPGSANSALACFRVNTTETIWVSAVVSNCNSNQVVPQPVSAMLCGLYTRFDSATPLVCSGIPEIDTLAPGYQPDTDASDYDAYADYAGNGRRIVTIPIVEALNALAPMAVLGFRQFLIMPEQGGVVTNPSDAFGRFIGMYIGSVAPVKQGRFDGCQQTAGPGKVVLYQ